MNALMDARKHTIKIRTDADTPRTERAHAVIDLLPDLNNCQNRLVHDVLAEGSEDHTCWPNPLRRIGPQEAAAEQFSQP